MKLADANGLKGRRVTTVEELEAAIQEALEEQKKGCLLYTSGLVL